MPTPKKRTSNTPGFNRLPTRKTTPVKRTSNTPGFNRLPINVLGPIVRNLTNKDLLDLARLGVPTPLVARKQEFLLELRTMIGIALDAVHANKACKALEDAQKAAEMHGYAWAGMSRAVREHWMPLCGAGNKRPLGNDDNRIPATMRAAVIKGTRTSLRFVFHWSGRLQAPALFAVITVSAVPTKEFLGSSGHYYYHTAKYMYEIRRVGDRVLVKHYPESYGNRNPRMNQEVEQEIRKALKARRHTGAINVVNKKNWWEQNEYLRNYNK